MVDAPERIWVQPENRTPIDEDPRHAGHNDVEYVRADLYEQVKRELIKITSPEYLAKAIEKVGMVDKVWKDRAEAAERLAGAWVATDEVVKSITDFICHDILPAYGIESAVGRDDPELSSAVRTALSALAEPAGEAEPADCIACEDSPKGENNPCAVCGKALTPPDASAIREALNTAIYRLCLIENKQALNEGEKALVREWIAEARAALAGAKP